MRNEVQTKCAMRCKLKMPNDVQTGHSARRRGDKRKLFKHGPLINETQTQRNARRRDDMRQIISQYPMRCTGYKRQLVEDEAQCAA